MEHTGRHRINRFRQLWRSLLVTFVLLSGCKDPVDQGYTLLSEQVLYNSSDILRLTGRVVSSIEINGTEHGFEVDTDINFSNPKVLNLGEYSGPGVFLGEINSLESETEYFWRAFLTRNGEVIYAEPKSATTLLPTVSDFFPKIASSNTSIFLNGTNLPENAEVYFGDAKATINRKQYDSRLRVFAPPIGLDHVVEVRLESNGNVYRYSDPFEYIIGGWEVASVFPIDKQMSGNLTLKLGDEVIFGLGKIGAFNTDRLWKYDHSNQLWSEISYPGEPVSEPFFGGRYFGGGKIGNPPFPGANPIYSDKLWKYENGVITLESTTPFFLKGAVAFELENKFYVMGGEENTLVHGTTMYSFDTIGKTWEVLGQIPQPMYSNMPAFMHDGRFYILTADGILRTYDPASNAWAIETQSPEAPADNGIGALIGDKAFIGFANGNRTLTEYDFTTGSWKPKSTTVLPATISPLGIWVHEGKLYAIMYSASGSVTGINVWEFDPDDY